MLAEVSQPAGANQSSRGGRHEDLATVTGCGNASRPVDVRSDVPLVGQDRRSGVQTYAHPNRAGVQSCQDLSARAQRSRRGLECDEKRVALGIDLDSAVGVE